MDGELGDKLQQILSDPGQMEKLTKMAQELFGGAAPAQETQAAPAAGNGPEPDAKLLAALGRAFSGGGDRGRSSALLAAMRPYMRPEKQEKLDRAMQIARMVHIAGAVVKEYGDGHGL